MIDGSALTVTLVWRDGARHVVVDAPPPASWSRMMLGKPGAEAARIAGLLADTCPTAHEAAARAAFGLSERPAHQRRIAVENLREHAVKCLVGWPRALGWPTETPPAAVNDAHDGGVSLALALFGPEGLPEHIEGLEAWMRAGATAPARVLDQVWRRWDGRWGRADLPLWRAGDGCAGLDFAEGELDGAAFDLSVAARVADAHLMREVEARRGRGIAWRLLARLVDAARLVRGLREEGPLDAPRALAPGVGMAEAAGGAIIVSGLLTDGRVSRYEQLTPTDCALHDDGLLRRMLAAAPHGRDAPHETVAAMMIEAVDVRAPTRLIVRDRPQVEGPRRAVRSANN